MGKVIKKIAKGVLIAGAIALAFVPGAQPFAIELGLAAGLSFGAGLTVISAITIGGLVVGLGIIAKALGPSSRSLDQQSGLKFALRSTVAPRIVVYGRARIAGMMAYAGNHSTDNKFLSMIFIVAGHEIDSFEKWYINDDLVTLDGSGFVSSGQYVDKVKIISEIGDQTVANATLVSDISEWTTDQKLLGLAYYGVRLEFDQEVFPNREPRINAIVKGAPLYDPRLDSNVPGGSGSHDPDDEGTWEWSENWALCVLDYLKRNPLGARIPIAEINLPSIITAANISDEDVTLDGGGTQKRYTLNGVVSSSDRREDIIGAMLLTGAGRLVFQSGKFTLYAGADTAATLSFDEDDLAGPLKIQTRKSRRELVNRVTGQFIDAQNDLYERNNYPAFIDSAAETADGEVLELPLDLPFIQNGIRAQRVAKIALRESRQQLTATMPLNLKGLQIQAHSVIKVTNSLFSWVNKKFRVLGWSLTPDGVIVEMVEYDPSIYAWDETTEEQAVQVPVAPTLEDGLTVPALTGLTVTPTLVTGTDTTKTPALSITWTLPSTLAKITEVQFKKTADSDWDSVSVVQGTEIRALQLAVEPNTAYDVQARHASFFGRFGTFAQALNTTSSVPGISENTLHSTVRQDQGDGTGRLIPIGDQYIIGRDGDTITFGTAYNSAPNIQYIRGGANFDGSGLSNTVAQQPAIIADNITANGFDIVAEIKELAGSIVTEVDGDGTGAEVAWHADAGHGADPLWQAGKENSNQAWDSTYVFKYTVTASAPIENWIRVEFYSNNGAGHVQRGNSLHFNSETNATKSIVTSGLTVHAGEEYGMDVQEFAGNGVLADVVDVTYDRATAPSVVTATPSGATDVVYRVVANLEG